MTSRRIAGLMLFVTVTSATTTAIVLARGQATTRPGDPTQARVWVENRNRSEAIPVRLDQPVIETVSARQRWEYRSIAMPPGADPARVFNATVSTDGKPSACCKSARRHRSCSSGRCRHDSR